MDASQMLKPMLARGELHTIGATTLDEYRKHIEKDAALERRFQTVLVDEPGVDDTISILRGPARALRDPPRRPAQGRRAGRRRGAVAPLHRRPVPARQGDRPGRRGGIEAAHGDRLDAGGARRGPPPHHAARNRARGVAQGDRQALDRAAGPAGRRAGEPEGGGDPAADAVEPREGGHPGLTLDQGGAGTGASSPSRKRSAPATTPRRRSCSTASCPSWNGASTIRRRVCPRPANRSGC